MKKEAPKSKKKNVSKRKKVSKSKKVSKNKRNSRSKKDSSLLDKLNKKITRRHFFILCDGRPIKSIKELVEMLPVMDDNVFYHHANEGRNDFANWIKDVFELDSLAEEIKKARDQMHMQYLMFKYIAESMLK